MPTQESELRRTRKRRVVKPAGQAAPEYPQSHRRPHQSQPFDREGEDGELIHILPEGIRVEDIIASSQPHE